MANALKAAKLLLLGLVLAAFSAALVQGKPEYGRKEKATCTTCHTKMGSKELNDMGKCYAKSKSLKDCKAAEQKLGPQSSLRQ